mgnify:CR=1 FL=1
MATSCSDFLDTAPKDALSPVSTWQTQEDADKFLVGCYNNWQDQYNSGWGWDGFLLYWDGTSTSVTTSSLGRVILLSVMVP